MLFSNEAKPNIFLHGCAPNYIYIYIYIYDSLYCYLFTSNYRVAKMLLMLQYTGSFIKKNVYFLVYINCVYFERVKLTSLKL